MSLRAALDQLDQEIEETEVFSRLHRVRKGRYLFDHALALYLQVALEAADAVRLLAREQHVRRAPLLARFLWETLIDVAYLTTRDAADQEEAAARSLAWVLLEVERHYANAQAAEGPGDRVPAPTPPETAEQGLERTCLSLKAHGVSCEPVRRAFQELRGKKSLPTHWSGHSARTRMEMANRAGISVRGWDRWAQYVYNLFSSGSHTSPIWSYVSGPELDHFVDPGQPMQIPDGFSEDEENAIGMVEVPLAVLPLLRGLARQAGW